MPLPMVAGFHKRGVTALPGYFISDTPWAGTKSNTNWSTRTQDSSLISGGRLDSSGAQNDLFTEDHWVSTGTCKVALIHSTASTFGIHNITGLSGTQTVDGYSGGGAGNVYTEVTGVAVTAGLKTVQDSMATKNDLATNYFGKINTLAIVRTGA